MNYDIVIYFYLFIYMLFNRKPANYSIFSSFVNNYYLSAVHSFINN